MRAHLFLVYIFFVALLCPADAFAQQYITGFHSYEAEFFSHPVTDCDAMVKGGAVFNTEHDAIIGVERCEMYSNTSGAGYDIHNSLLAALSVLGENRLQE